MKTVFFVMVIGSLGYLAYQESPQIAQWIDAAPVASIPSMDTINREYKKGLKEVKDKLQSASQVQNEALETQLRVSRSEQADLAQQLIEKDVMINQQKEMLAELRSEIVAIKSSGMQQASTLNDNAFNKQVIANVQRRESLARLAERMELQSLGFASE